MPNAKPKSRKRQRKPKNKQKSSEVNNAPISSGATFAPVAKQTVVKNNGPSYKNSREGITITHEEFIADIVRTNSVYTSDTFSINPGVASTFPWLSTVAGRYESYTFERLDFIFKPMVATTQAGSVMMAVDFDAADAPPTTKTQLLSYQGAVRGAPWQPFRLGTTSIDRKKLVSERMVRTGVPPSGTDIRTSDAGNLFVATVGTGAATVTLGELHVSYKIRLRTPQITTAPGLGLNRRASQTGTLTCEGLTGTILSNIANIVGEGNSPICQAASNGRALLFEPRLRRFLFNYVARPNGVWNTPTNISTMFFNPGFSSSFPLYGRALDVARQLMRIGRPAGAFLQSANSGSSAPLIESLVFSEASNETLQDSASSVGSARSSWPLPIRGISRFSNNDFTVDYTVIPLDVDLWPQIDATLPVATSEFLEKVVQWPTTFDVIPSYDGKMRIGGDNGPLNVFTFNEKQSHPAPPEGARR